eukprot:NODE_2334_length_954_cov_314.420467.p2 GENE.NODE_2334_length_954_cov_314.420467~~NODE_2334_length_954_cov_314.420467.p2  ORF type:complete len:247 (+),score=59.71 NODE_2334_length_954_cov_314.420467:38-778(+)
MDWARFCLAMSGTFLFTIVIVNLIIAVYSNEYESMDRESTHHFMRERAAMNCRYALEFETFAVQARWVRPAWLTIVIGSTVVTIALTFINAFAEEPASMQAWDKVTFGILGFILGVGQLLFVLWVREEPGDADAEGASYLWVWHEANFNEDSEADQPLEKGDLSVLVPSKDMNVFTEEMRALRYKVMKQQQAGGIASSLETAHKRIKQLQQDIGHLKGQTQQLEKAWHNAVSKRVEEMSDVDAVRR